MAAVTSVSVDQLLCPICLEVFTDPVSTSCGHTFCKTCINTHWDNSAPCSCPICKHGFSSRPQLQKNTCLSEMVSAFQTTEEVKKKEVKRRREEAAPGEVPCDLCSDSEPPQKAVKSCLLCLASYCPAHLQPHQQNPRLKRHHLIEAVQDLENRLCAHHDTLLQLFCRQDSQLICLQCLSENHKGHQAVPLSEEREAKLQHTKQAIQKRRLKIEEISKSVDLSKRNSNKEIQEGEKVFRALIDCVQNSLEMFKKGVKEKHKKVEKEAAGLVQKVKNEILTLEQREAEMEQMSSCEDHLQVLQRFLQPPEGVSEAVEGSVGASYEGTVTKCLSDLHPRLNQEFGNVSTSALQRLKKLKVSITLDPETAHRDLEVSSCLKEVKHTKKATTFPSFFDNRFSNELYVLGKQGFSSGRFYFEVGVKNKLKWCVGVANETARRQGQVDTTCSFFCEFWLIQWNNECFPPANVGGRSVFPKSIPETVGVFVDYEKRLVCFYDVLTADLIGSITDCRFSGNIRPIFSPGKSMDSKNSAPLTLTPDHHFGFGFSTSKNLVTIFSKS